MVGLRQLLESDRPDRPATLEEGRRDEALDVPGVEALLAGPEVVLGAHGGGYLRGDP